MRIAIAQTKPIKGDIQANIEQHLQLIDLALANKAAAIFFPELSITGYEPTLAKELATDKDDKRFDVFQQVSDAKNIIIGIGLPLKSAIGVCISMVLFQPNQTRQAYFKKYLHADELPFFVINENTIELLDDMALAICYEISVPAHAEDAHKKGAKVYLASVAKSVGGVDKALNRLSEIAKTYQMTVFMSNCAGYCDDFECGGKSAVWNHEGIMLAQLSETEVGILAFDEERESKVQKLN